MHGEQPTPLHVFGGFDESVGAGGDGAEPGAGVVGIDGLVVAAGDFEVAGAADDFGEPRPGGDLDGVQGVGFVPEAVGDRRVEVEVVEVLDEASATGDVGELVAEAESEGGLSAGIGAAEEVDFEAVAAVVEDVGGRVDGLAVVAGVEVEPAGEDETVAAIEQGVEERVVPLRGQGDGLREGAGVEDGVGIAGEEVELLAGRVVAVDVEVARDADGWAHGMFLCCRAGAGAPEWRRCGSTGGQYS